MADEWGTESGYSVRDTYTRASDKNGHRERPRISMPPDLWDAVCALVGSQMVPGYNAPSDFVRDAIVHRLKYWQENPVIGMQDWERTWVVAFALTLTEKSSAMLKALRELPEAHRSVMEAAWNDGAYDVVEEGLNEMRGLVFRLPAHVAQQMLVTIDEYTTRLSRLRELQVREMLRQNNIDAQGH